jgi:hypothetical protein
MKHLFVLLASGLVVGASAYGCSSGDSSGGPGDAGTDGGVVHKEAAASDDGGGQGDAPTGMPVDMTSGKTCTKDTDCKADPNNPGLNVCSNRYGFKITGLTVSLWPTPLCIVTLPQGGGGNCDPAPPADPAGQGLHFCDGPDDPTAPGICLPLNAQTPMAGQGICLPKCTMKPDGTATTGCPGKDTCVPYTWTLDQSGVVTGFGFCQGTCQQDSDCSALGTGFVCQQDIGFCAKAAAQATRSKKIGDACAQADETSGACHCEYNQNVPAATVSGFCTSACVVGGKACVNGWTCEAGEITPLVFSNDGGTIPLTGQNTGTSGNCFQPCTNPVGDAGTDAASDAATDAAPPPPADGGTGGSCPPNTTCQNITAAGPDCLIQ